MSAVAGVFFLPDSKAAVGPGAWGDSTALRVEVGVGNADSFSAGRRGEPRDVFGLGDLGDLGGPDGVVALGDCCDLAFI